MAVKLKINQILTATRYTNGFIHHTAWRKQQLLSEKVCLATNDKVCNDYCMHVCIGYKLRRNQHVIPAGSILHVTI